MQETWFGSLSQEDLLEKKMATHSGILAWEIPWIAELGGLESMGLQSLTCLSPSTRTTKFVGTSQSGPPPTSKPSLATGGQTWNQTIQPAPKCYKNSQWKAACYLKHKIMGESETATKAPDFQATEQIQLCSGIHFLCFGQLFRTEKFFKCLLKIKS